MKTRLALLSAVLAISAPAMANDYTAFLQTLEGNWSGQGTISYIENPNGNESYNLAFSEQARDGSSWDAFFERSSQVGGTSTSQSTFSITGQFLLIDDDSVSSGTSSFDYSTPTELDYTISEFGDNGEFIDHHYVLQVSPTSFEGSIVIESNGMEVSEENFSASRSQ